ncbi:NAD-dependent epimerase/dehydratase family protein [Thiomicrorhabdus sp.]|uniref:NAD-dependent epimerase/dehydratase family protein n=1 Tax=Thiomicrorhabdus sp. TaxID=2039724 RepID=UPI0029C67C35|nr:NAD-dependent epimerase/dehydratase family protein [Thiomicrorhabdus sp.]
MTLLIIGMNSFIAKQFISECEKNNIPFTACNHNNVPAMLDKYDWVVNFSLNPKLFNEIYSESIDQDFLISQKVARTTSTTKFAFISSRTVYGIPNVLEPIPETFVCDKNNPRKYGENKLISENRCREILGDDRLLVTRASNIFGLEIGRHTFMGIAQKRLVERSEILLDISKKTKRDFIPVTTYCSALLELILKDKTGLFNVGSGHATSLEEICTNIINGYGRGTLLEMKDVEIKDQFVLDTIKLKNSISFSTSEKDILEYCKNLGNQLKKVKNELQ